MNGWDTWRGPDDGDLADPETFTLRAPVPPDRWPFGPPANHEECCVLHEVGLFCDCLASAATGHDDEDLCG